MSGKPTAKSSYPMTMTRRLAAWIGDFAESEVSARTAERARAILLDTLACALYARADEKSRPAFRALPRLGGNGDCTIIGSRARGSLPVAVFANGVLIRLLDLNDTYSGPRNIGHPSDNIAEALAAAEMADRSGKDLIKAIRLGYEIYGRIIDIGNPDSPWDHVTVSGIVAAAIAGWLLRLPAEQLTNALALAAMHCATLGQVRAGQVSGAKSIANATVAHTACLLTLLAAEGMTGPEEALEGARGYCKLLLDGADFADFFKEGGEDRLLSVGLKQYPCFALAQGPISAAAELRQRVSQPEQLQRLKVVLADTKPARLRLGDEHGRNPTSSEAADHSIYFIVAAALLDGRFGLDQLRAGRWRDRDVIDLIARMDFAVDASLQPKAALPCRLEAVLADGGRCIVERQCTPGFASNPLSWDQVVEKFRSCARGVLDDRSQAEVVACVNGIDQLPSVRTLLKFLVADDSRRD